MREVLRYVRLSGASFMVTLVGCVWLQPGDIWTHNGLSFYGNFQRTLLPYMIGLSLAAYFLLRASSCLPDGLIGGRVQRPLRYSGFALVGVMLTPSLSPSRPVQLLHVFCGGLVFGLQLVVSWRLIHLQAASLDQALFVVQLTALVVLLLSFGEIHELSVMLPAQALAIGAFGAELWRALRREGAPTETVTVVSWPTLPPGKL